MRLVTILLGTTLLFVWGGPMPVKAQVSTNRIRRSSMPRVAIMSNKPKRPCVITQTLKQARITRLPLMWAAQGNNADVIRFLLEKHANVEAKDQFGQTALHYAATHGNAEVVRLLLDNHANVDARSSSGTTPLIEASTQGETDVVKVLLAFHPNLELHETVGNDAFITSLEMVSFDAAAKQSPHLGVAQLLLDGGVNVDERDGNGQTPLMLMISKDHSADVIAFLLQNHADPNTSDKYGNTPLSMAVGTGKADLVNLLLDHHADLEDSSGSTVLMYAVSSKETDMVKLLLDRHANFEAVDKDGQTPLIVAIQRENGDIVKLLLDRGANIEARNKAGQTPLAFAASLGNADMVKLLLDRKANIEARDNDGYTPLMWAAGDKSYGKNEEKNEEVIKLLLQHGASIEAVDSHYGLTPLIVAARTDNSDAIKLLLAQHANERARTTQDFKGWSGSIGIPKGSMAIDFAEQGGNCESLQKLEHGGQHRTLACLESLAESYRKDPSRSYLLDQAARTAAAMAPRPDISEEARESYVKANVTYRSAQGNDDIRTAIALYKDALGKAPWFSDAWYNLSLAQEKLGDYKDAASSMKTMEPLEAGGPNERRDLDRVYALEAQGESASDRKQKQDALDAAVGQMRKAIGGYTLYKFFLIRKQDGSTCSFDELADAHDPCLVYASDQQGYADHDGSPIGAQANVDTEGGQVVLALGAQRFCVPVDQVGMAMIGVDHQSLIPLVHGITDCGSPAGAVWDFTSLSTRLRSGGERMRRESNGTVSIEVTKCSEAVCRHDDRADIATYWLKP